MSIKCKVDSCPHHTIYGSEFCWDHVKDKASYAKRLQEKLKENISCKGANFTKAELRDIDFSQANLAEANLSRADLTGSIFFATNLKNAEFLGTNLSDCDFTSANLEGADFTRSFLNGARLWHANLTDSTLIEAELTNCDLWNATLFNARLWRTNLLHAISLSKRNFQKDFNQFASRCQINEKGILSAEEAYRSLKRYFLSSGRYNDASWASFKEKTMERLLLRQKRKITYLPSAVMNLLCGYGEKPHRIIISSFCVILSYAVAFSILRAVTYAPSAKYVMTRADHLYYSIITFTTVGYGDFIPKATFLFRFLAASEAFIGAFMIGLFIFTLARKYSAR